MRNRLGKLNPPPVGAMPLLIGGSGRKVTLRLGAEYADAWNCFGPPDNVAELSAILDEWWPRLARGPAEIEHTVNISRDDVHDVGRYIDVGVDHVVVMIGQQPGAVGDFKKAGRPEGAHWQTLRPQRVGVADRPAGRPELIWSLPTIWDDTRCLEPPMTDPNPVFVRQVWVHQL
ncbi:MAG: hypothetical protein CM1200mP26_26590 [Acidimicrobiales bacterium]|nr:MAG: hypothetical protein CM1200mP26_26590 [Acidimicrobiales bacterium]